MPTSRYEGYGNLEKDNSNEDKDFLKRLSKYLGEIAASIEPESIEDIMVDESLKVALETVVEYAEENQESSADS